MSERRVLLCALGLPILLAAGVALAQTQSHAAEGERPACVRARGEARAQAYGWNHVVVIENTCTAAVTCRVSSDVNPSPVTVQVPAGQTRETVTFLDSPASAFVGRASCETPR